MQASRSLPPGGGSRQDRGEARGRAGGGAPPPRLVIYREKISVPRLGGPAPSISLRLSANSATPLLGARASRPHPVPANAPSPAVPGRPHPAPWNGVQSLGKHKGTLLNYWNNLDRQILNSGCPTTSPTCVLSFSAQVIASDPSADNASASWKESNGAVPG